ncbi:MAG: hypothetical protein Q9220_003222 [cf. Caloplaca sp. 1 TL-2023]
MDSPSAEVPVEPLAYNSLGAPCKSCGTPDRSNMNWDDGAKDFFSTWFATKRMGPIGYILGSPYSPLRAELEIPSHNWRDAFEDLLAIDTGGQMIAEEDRKAEDAFAARNRYDIASQQICVTNAHIKYNLEQEREALEIREDVVKNGKRSGYSPDTVPYMDETLLPDLKIRREALTHVGQKSQQKYEEEKDKSASSLKPRGQWIASLMTSGAMPGWGWNVSSTLDGPLVGYQRLNAPPPELAASIEITERELNWIFDQKQSPYFGGPGYFPREHIQALANGSLGTREPEAGEVISRRFRPGPSSILAQVVSTEAFKAADGSRRGMKVFIQNRLVNGTVVDRTYVRQPARVLEEVENARHSMEEMRMCLQGAQDEIYAA